MYRERRSRLSGKPFGLQFLCGGTGGTSYENSFPSHSGLYGSDDRHGHLPAGSDPGVGSCGQASEIFLSPDTILVGDELRIRITGLPKHTHITLHAQRFSSLDPHGSVWHYSYTCFDTQERDSIDLAQDAPGEGTYQGVDVRGILWSMQPMLDDSVAATLMKHHSTLTPKSSLTADAVMLDLEVGEKIVDSRSLYLTTSVKGLLIEDVRDEGLRGVWIHPSTTEQLPGIMILSGSAGWIWGVEKYAELVASKGYSVLALAYFRSEGLPDTLAEIPGVVLSAGS